MAVYFVAELLINDADRYAAYLASVSSIVRAYGGTYIVRGGTPHCLAGEWQPDRLVIIEFDSLRKLRACFSSEEYLALVPLRDAAIRSRAVAVHGALQDSSQFADDMSAGPAPRH